MTNADELDAVWAEAAAVFEEEFYTDDYRIVRMVKVRDTRAGTTETEQQIDSGKCALNESGAAGLERLSGSRVAGITPYTADFPLGTDLLSTDTVYINDRKFKVVNVVKAGHWATGVVADLEEWS